MLEKKGTEVGTAMVTWDAGVRALNHGTKDELVSGGSELTSFTIEIILLTLFGGLLSPLSLSSFSLPLDLQKW